MHVGISSGFANHASIDDRQFVSEEMIQLSLAEELGFDSIWLTEHHFSDYSVSPNPLQYLTWLAGKTRTCRLGTQVVVAPWHDPVRLAEQIAVLDHLSAGRAIIGFGRGLARMEFEGMRVDQNSARELFDDIVPMVMAAMDTGVIAGGTLFKQPRREIRPRPIRSLRGRAFCAAGTQASMVAAARFGLGRLYLGQPMVSIVKPTFAPQNAADFSTEAQKPPATPAGPLTPEDAWDAAWREHHPDQVPPAPFVSNFVFIDESKDRAEELARKYSKIMFRWIVRNYSLTSSYAHIKGYETYSSLTMSEAEVETAAEASIANSIYGDPKTVLAKLDEVRGIRKPQGMIPHLYSGGMTHEQALRSIRLFAKRCLPEMKSWAAAPATIDSPFIRAAA